MIHTTNDFWWHEVGIRNPIQGGSRHIPLTVSRLGVSAQRLIGSMDLYKSRFCVFPELCSNAPTRFPLAWDSICLA